MRIFLRRMLPKNIVFPMVYLMRLRNLPLYIYNGEFSKIYAISNGFLFR